MRSRRIRNFLAIVEIRTKVVSVSSFFLGTLFALTFLSSRGISREGFGSVLLASGRSNAGLSIGRALLMFLATLCVDMGTTAWNTYFDFLRGTDDPRINREPDKVLVHGSVPPAFAFWTAFWLYIAAMGGGILLSVQVGFWILPVGALCMAVGFFYNAGPLPISHTPVGELFAGGFLGSGLFLISFGVQVAGRIEDWTTNEWLSEAGSIHAGSAVAFLNLLFNGDSAWYPITLAVFASIPSLFAVAAILAVNNACDVEGDRLGGRKTLAVLLGQRAGEALSFVLAVLAPLTGGALSWMGVLPKSGMYAFIVSLLFTVYEFYGMHQRGFSHSTKSRNMKSIIRAFGVWSLAYGATLLK